MRWCRRRHLRITRRAGPNLPFSFDGAEQEVEDAVMHARIAERRDEVDDQYRTDHIRNRLSLLADESEVDDVESVSDKHTGETPDDFSSERRNLLTRCPELFRYLRRRHEVHDDANTHDKSDKKSRHKVHAGSPENN